MSTKSFLALLLLCGTGTVHAAAPDLQWDLSYQSALKAYPIGETEYMQSWMQNYPKRLIHERMAAYSGEPIEASLLVEQPDGHTGDPAANWYIKTRSGAQLCSFHVKRAKEPCKPLDPVRTERMIRQVMTLPRLPPVSSSAKESSSHGSPFTVNYFGFVSVYVDGKALQRPVAMSEWQDTGTDADGLTYARDGRLQQLLALFAMNDQEQAKYAADQERTRREQSLVSAIRRGDQPAMERLLDEAGKDGTATLFKSIPVISHAAGAGQKGAIEFLLRRGASIDALESAALKAAVHVNDTGMLEFLLAKGAKIDPPRESLNSYGYIYQSALGLAVAERKDASARLLIQRGADVNIEQGRTMLAFAATNRDYAMVDLLLKRGAKPDGIARNEYLTPLMYLAGLTQQTRRSGSEAERAGSAEWQEDQEQLARRLVAGGANVNFITRTCETPLSIAKERGSGSMHRLLLELGAAPRLAEECQNKGQLANQGARSGSEATVREALAKEVTAALNDGDYAKLEAWHKQLVSDKERTPSGVWKLAVYYGQLRGFPSRSRDAAYWDKMSAKAADWDKKYPQSLAAKMFRFYLYWNRVQSARGTAFWEKLAEADRNEVTKWGTEAYRLLQRIEPQAAKARDPEWYRAMVWILPYTGVNRSQLAVMEEGAKLYPAYHELFFTTAFYSQEMWKGAPDAIEQVARHAATVAGASASADSKAMYARVYWYMDASLYHGTLFDKGQADWATMKTSFDAMVQTYPDPWNLNAYAYFACMAKDYGTMNSVLERIGDQLVSSTWGEGGTATYTACATHAKDDTRNYASVQKGIVAARQTRYYNEMVSYAYRKREAKQYDESLRAILAVQKFDQQLGRVAMMTQFNLGHVLLEMKRYQEAVEAFTQGIPQQPGYAAAYWKRGLAFEGMGRKDSAKADFVTAASKMGPFKPGSDAAQNEAERKIRWSMQEKFSEYGIQAP